jgi:uncharacterized membrane protein
MLLPIHIAAGGLAIILGAVALSVKKGGTIHRRSGLLFVYAMLVSVPYTRCQHIVFRTVANQ